MSAAAETNDPILSRVPIRLRLEYDAAWDRYQSTVITGGTPAQRAHAYEQARKQEELLAASTKIAAEEHRRHLQRNAQHA